MSEPDNQTDYADENRQIRKIAVLAFLLNLLLALVKGYLAYRSSSLAITAGAVDSATDSIASLAIFGGLLLSTRKSRAFPLGLYKIENLISVVIAFFIFFAGYEIARRMIESPSGPPDINLPLLWWILGCTVATFLFGKYALYLGQKTESPTLIAEGRHRQVDVLASLVVLLSVLLNYYGIEFQYRFLTIDHIAALLVLLFIIKAGWELLSDGMRVLLDASIDYQALEKARNIIEKEPAVKQVRSVVGRNAGRFRFLNAEVMLRIDDFKKAHDVVHRLENTIKNEIPHVAQVNLHYEPPDSRTLLVAFPVLDDGNQICDHFGEAPYFIIWQIDTRELQTEKKTLVKNPYSREGKGKGIQTARFLVEQNIDMVGTRKKLEQSGPGYVFSDAGVETREIDEETADQVIERFFFK
ncbi:MAG: cation diffusion facilitator family transporter [Thermodesulfobacteriota bacterium]